MSILTGGLPSQFVDMAIIAVPEVPASSEVAPIIAEISRKVQEFSAAQHVLEETTCHNKITTVPGSSDRKRRYSGGSDMENFDGPEIPMEVSPDCCATNGVQTSPKKRRVALTPHSPGYQTRLNAVQMQFFPPIMLLAYTSATGGAHFFCRDARSVAQLHALRHFGCAHVYCKVLRVCAPQLQMYGLDFLQEDSMV